MITVFITDTSQGNLLQLSRFMNIEVDLCLWYLQFDESGPLLEFLRQAALALSRSFSLSVLRTEDRP